MACGLQAWSLKQNIWKVRSIWSLSNQIFVVFIISRAAFCGNNTSLEPASNNTDALFFEYWTCKNCEQLKYGATTGSQPNWVVLIVSGDLRSSVFLGQFRHWRAALTQTKWKTRRKLTRNSMNGNVMNSTILASLFYISDSRPTEFYRQTKDFFVINICSEKKILCTYLYLWE